MRSRRTLGAVSAASLLGVGALMWARARRIHNGSQSGEQRRLPTIAFYKQHVEEIQQMAQKMVQEMQALLHGGNPPSEGIDAAALRELAASSGQSEGTSIAAHAFSRTETALEIHTAYALLETKAKAVSELIKQITDATDETTLEEVSAVFHSHAQKLQEEAFVLVKSANSFVASVAKAMQGAHRRAIESEHAANAGALVQQAQQDEINALREASAGTDNLRRSLEDAERTQQVLKQHIANSEWALGEQRQQASLVQHQANLEVQQQATLKEADLKRQIDEKDGRLKAVEKALAVPQGQQTGADDLLQALHTLLTQRDSLEARAQALQTQRDSLEARAKALQTQRDSLEARAQALQTQGDSLEARAQALQTQEDSLEARAQAAEQQAGQMSAGLEKAQTERDSLGQQVQTLAQNATCTQADLRQRMHEAEAKLTAVQKALSISSDQQPKGDALVKALEQLRAEKMHLEQQRLNALQDQKNLESLFRHDQQNPGSTELKNTLSARTPPGAAEDPMTLMWKLHLALNEDLKTLEARARGTENTLAAQQQQLREALKAASAETVHARAKEHVLGLAGEEADLVGVLTQRHQQIMQHLKEKVDDAKAKERQAFEALQTHKRAAGETVARLESKTGQQADEIKVLKESFAATQSEVKQLEITASATAQNLKRDKEQFQTILEEEQNKARQAAVASAEKAKKLESQLRNVQSQVETARSSADVAAQRAKALEENLREANGTASYLQSKLRGIDQYHAQEISMYDNAQNRMQGLLVSLSNKLLAYEQEATQPGTATQPTGLQELAAIGTREGEVRQRLGLMKEQLDKSERSESQKKEELDRRKEYLRKYAEAWRIAADTVLSKLREHKATRAPTRALIDRTLARINSVFKAETDVASDPTSSALSSSEADLQTAHMFSDAVATWMASMPAGSRRSKKQKLAAASLGGRPLRALPSVSKLQRFPRRPLRALPGVSKLQRFPWRPLRALPGVSELEVQEQEPALKRSRHFDSEGLSGSSQALSLADSPVGNVTSADRVGPPNSSSLDDLATGGDPTNPADSINSLTLDPTETAHPSKKPRNDASSSALLPSALVPPADSSVLPQNHQLRDVRAGRASSLVPDRKVVRIRGDSTGSRSPRGRHATSSEQ